MAVRPIPEGTSAVTPYLVVDDVAQLLGFLESPFGAEVLEEVPGEANAILHAEVRIRDARVMMGTAREGTEAYRAMLYVYVDDVDHTYRRALEAGAMSVQEPATQFYGDRTAGVRGPDGNTYTIATHVEDVSPEEMKRRMEQSRS